MPEPQVFVATGKRKTAVARVRLRIGSGQIRVNDRTLEDYFPREASRMIIHQPLETVNGVGRYDITATLHGGGISGQAGAVRHGVAQGVAVGLRRLKRKPSKVRPHAADGAGQWAGSLLRVDGQVVL